VMFVGNNWDGTADIIDARTFERLARIDTIPDKDERLREIYANPVRLAFFLAIRMFVGEGHDQYTDDMFTTHDGTLVAVSRPSFADVVGIDLGTQEIVWRFPMEGQRADHMALSPDGSIRLHGEQGPRARHPHRREDGRVPVRRLPATTTRTTASGSSTPASGGSTRRPTARSWGPRATPARASATSRS
jgi:hypothetical protein